MKRPEDGSVQHCIGQTMSHQRYHYRGLIYGEALTAPLLDVHATANICAPGRPWQQLLRVAAWSLLWSKICTVIFKTLIHSIIHGLVGKCMPSWTSRQSLKALLVVCRLGCGVQRVGAVDPAHERGQPSQGQVIMQCTRAAITELRLSFKDGDMLMP